MQAFYSHLAVSSGVRMDGVEKVSRRLQRRSRTAKSKVISLKTGNGLAKVMSLLNEDVGVIFCGKMVALLRTCFFTVHHRREELAKETAMTRFHVVNFLHCGWVCFQIFHWAAFLHFFYRA